MKIIRIISLMMSLGLSGTIDAQLDTITGVVDTLICSNLEEEQFFFAPYDTSTYSFEWYNIITDTAFSSSDSIPVNHQDSLILVSVSSEMEIPNRLDTIFIRIRYYPVTEYFVPNIDCYTRDTLVIEDNTVINSDSISVEFYDLSGEEYIKIDSLIKVHVGNGNSKQVIARYDVERCGAIVDTLLLSTKFKPIPMFDFEPICFDEMDTTVLYNTSIFDDSIAIFSLEVEGDLYSINSSQDSFLIYLPENNDFRNVYIEINQEECVTRDTFSIYNKLQPNAMFRTDTVCENELLTILNLSEDTLSETSYAFFDGNEVYPYEKENNLFRFLDTLPNGPYRVLGRVDNGNYCVDLDTFDIVVDSVTYISFEGLDTTFCENQTEVILEGSVGGGFFEGSYLTPLQEGKAIFAPSVEETNISITYIYTNDFDCTDRDTQIVPIVHPKPEINLSGVIDEHCQFDSTTVIAIAQTNPLASLFLLNRNDQFFDSIYTLEYTFLPDSAGVYDMLNVYTDGNGCFDSLWNEFIVYPLPQVDLESLQIISPGETIQLGDDLFEEQDVTYRWSNGSNLPYIYIGQPGIYTLEAYNEATSCLSTDTISVAYDIDIQKELVEIQIGPNPTSDILNFQSSLALDKIRLLDVNSNEVQLNGTSIFKTDSTGFLTLDLSNVGNGYYYLVIPELGNFLIVKI